MSVTELFYKLRHDNKMTNWTDHEILLSKELPQTLKQALLNCAIKKRAAVPPLKRKYKTYYPKETNSDVKYFSFNRNKTSLAECVNGYLLKTNCLYKENGMAKVIAKRCANKFSEKTVTKKEFLDKIRLMFYYLKRKYADLKNADLAQGNEKSFRELC